MTSQLECLYIWKIYNIFCQSFKSCIVCHFLRLSHPIQVILTYKHRGQWNKVDLHYCQPTYYSCRLINLMSDFFIFSFNLKASHSKLNGGGKWICQLCVESYIYPNHYKTCTYGPNLLLLHLCYGTAFQQGIMFLPTSPPSYLLIF